VLACCIHDHYVTYFLHAAIIMPDHVHLIISHTISGRWRQSCDASRAYLRD
jgi:REP element-mobilizing transposase RayT